MSNLFTDPVRWSGTAVGTWPRFLGVAFLFVGVTAYITSQTAGIEGRTAAGLAWLLAACQVMVLYALRQMYLKLRGAGATDRTTEHSNAA